MLEARFVVADAETAKPQAKLTATASRTFFMG